MSRDLQLLGRARRTRDGYLREIRKLACHFDQSPDRLSQQQVADYLLYLINDKLSVATSFVRGFVQHTLPSKFQQLRYYGWASPNCKLKF